MRGKFPNTGFACSVIFTLAQLRTSGNGTFSWSGYGAVLVYLDAQLKTWEASPEVSVGVSPCAKLAASNSGASAAN